MSESQCFLSFKGSIVGTHKILFIYLSVDGYLTASTSLGYSEYCCYEYAYIQYALFSVLFFQFHVCVYTQK